VGKKILLHGRFGYGHKERLQALAEAQGAAVTDTLDPSVHFLILSDLAGNVTLQKKVNSLNAKGAAIQTMDDVTFARLIEVDNDQILHLLHTGGPAAAETLQKVFPFSSVMRALNSGNTAAATITREDFRRHDLAGFVVSNLIFQDCPFTETQVARARFGDLAGCDFSRAQGRNAAFSETLRCRFVEANLPAAEFSGDFSESDFTAARLERANFRCDTHYYTYGKNRPRPIGMPGIVFNKATLRGASFADASMKAPSFNYADLSGALFSECVANDALFQHAIARNASFIGAKLCNADFTGADLRDANFANADLSGAKFHGADLQDANFRGATLAGADFSSARNYNPAPAIGAVGPATTELDTLVTTAKRVQFTFRVLTGADPEGEEVIFDSNALKWGWALRLPSALHPAQCRQQGLASVSDYLLNFANFLGTTKIRFETVDASATKSPTFGKELRDLVTRALSEVSAQPLPPADALVAAARAWREKEKEKSAAYREQLEKQREAHKQQDEARKQEAEATIRKEVGKVTDTATFLKALGLRIEAPKIKKATSMLKAEGFKLFNDITPDHLAGVVKSQSDPDLVYACRITRDGKYACCTQNLNVCGGLRGSICKHLLVLIIGLVQAGELDPETIDAWVAASNATKPELDKELMGEIFLKYKGAEAGEVDWRPTETMPEDYYAL
jgi:uncharacterized protein YjbI with pentapeptide repeats